MKCNHMGRGAKALAVSLALILGVSACSRDYTLAYLYVTAATQGTQGLIDAYAIDYQSGSLTTLADSPIPAGYDPVGLAALPDGNGLFVINKLSSTVIVYNIGTDGKLYASATYNTSGTGGTYPTSVAVDSAGKFLYIVYTFQNGYTTASPGPGGIAVFPINEATNPTNVTLGTPTDYKLGNNPVGVAAGAVTQNSTSPFIYVVDQEPQTLSTGVPSGTPFGVLRVFQENAGTGALTAADTGKTCTVGTNTAVGYCAGTLPAAVAVDPTDQFIYVSDSATNQIYGYLKSQTPTVVTPILSSPYLAGQLPEGMTIDPRGQFLYVANYNSSTVSGYTINASTGALTATGTATVATGPKCVTIENALGQYLFTSNYLDNSVSGEQMNVHTGSLTQIQGTQFTASALPTCAVAIANGSHPTAITAY